MKHLFGNLSLLVSWCVLPLGLLYNDIAYADCVAPPTGLVSWWRAEGNANDGVGGNNGNPTGGVVYASGKVGKAFVFNGTNAAIRVPASASLDVGTGGGFTVEGWINPSDVSQLHPIVEWNDGLNNGVGSLGVHFYISVDAGPGSFYANILDSDGGWHQMLTTVAPLTTNLFQHVALTYDKASGVAKIYCMGTLVAQQTLGSFTPKTSSDLYLGKRPPTAGETFNFAGLMDEMSLHNRALSAGEIAAIYNAGGAGKCTSSSLDSGLLLHYPFDGNALDTSGNNHDGQVNGAALCPDRFGTPNSAYSFNGSSAYILVPDQSKQLNFDARSNYYTVAMWVNLASLTQREELIMDRASPNNPPCSYRLFFDPSYGFVANCWDGVVNVEVASTTFPQTNRWYQVVMVDEGGTLKLYVNGNREFATAEPGALTNVPSNFGSTINNEPSRTIGRFAPAYNNYLNGVVDDVRIYSRALATNEIQQLYTTPPVITSQPTNPMVAAGGNATFSITAMGTDPLNYQWNFKGLPIDGATNASLTLSNVQISDAGIYFVTVTNLYGSDTSSNAVLKVNSPPVADASATTSLIISVNDSNATVVLDGSLSFDPDGDSLQYVWYQTGATDPLATGIVAVVVLPVGTNSITLQVNDGLASDQQAIAVEVITVIQAVERLKDAVSDAAHKQSLIASLNAALASIDRSNPTAAINQLQAFQSKVIAQISPLDPVLAQSLIDAAQSIINALSGGSPSQKAVKATAHGNGKIHLNFPGVHQQMYIIEASTNMVDWEKIGVAKDLGDGTFDFDDADAPRMSARYYRVVVP